jgi:hypothetical protein
MSHWLRAVAVFLVVVSLSAAWWRAGGSVPLYAARTGLLCQSCHFDPNGGGPRNELGFGFARARHSLEPEDTTSAWHDLAVVNRIGADMPVYIGVNHRLLLLANTTSESDSLDRAAFFNMENAIHLAFQPHPRLTLVHTRDGATSRESFGMIGGLPLGGYLKAGQFRNPFGLRMDDHTVATRNGFLDIYHPSVAFTPWGGIVNPRFLPYDPRHVDTGLEIGLERSGWYGRLALTNGNSNLFVPGLFGNPFAETKAVKLGYAGSYYQGGLSFYDDFQKNQGLFGPFKRATRWGYYGMAGTGPFRLLGEVAAGSDNLGARKRNLIAAFGELDYAPMRSMSFRLRYDYTNLDRDRTEVAPGISRSDLNVHRRYALEGEYVPVPFAELRWTLRRIDHRAGRAPTGEEIPDETQAYLQLHFSY